MAQLRAISNFNIPVSLRPIDDTATELISEDMRKFGFDQSKKGEFMIALPSSKVDLFRKVNPSKLNKVWNVESHLLDSMKYVFKLPEQTSTNLLKDFNFTDGRHRRKAMDLVFGSEEGFDSTFLYVKLLIDVDDSNAKLISYQASRSASAVHPCFVDEISCLLKDSSPTERERRTKEMKLTKEEADAITTLHEVLGEDARSVVLKWRALGLFSLKNILKRKNRLFWRLVEGFGGNFQTTGVGRPNKFRAQLLKLGLFDDKFVSFAQALVFISIVAAFRYCESEAEGNVGLSSHAVIEKVCREFASLVEQALWSFSFLSSSATLHDRLSVLWFVAVQCMRNVVSLDSLEESEKHFENTTEGITWTATFTYSLEVGERLFQVITEEKGNAEEQAQELMEKEVYNSPPTIEYEAGASSRKTPKESVLNVNAELTTALSKGASEEDRRAEKPFAESQAYSSAELHKVSSVCEKDRASECLEKAEDTETGNKFSVVEEEAIEDDAAVKEVEKFSVVEEEAIEDDAAVKEVDNAESEHDSQEKSPGTSVRGNAEALPPSSENAVIVSGTFEDATKRLVGVEDPPGQSEQSEEKENTKAVQKNVGDGSEPEDRTETDDDIITPVLTPLARRQPERRSARLLQKQRQVSAGSDSPSTLSLPMKRKNWKDSARPQKRTYSLRAKCAMKCIERARDLLDLVQFGLASPEKPSPLDSLPNDRSKKWAVFFASFESCFEANILESLEQVRNSVDVRAVVFLNASPILAPPSILANDFKLLSQTLIMGMSWNKSFTEIEKHCNGHFLIYADKDFHASENALECMSSDSIEESRRSYIARVMKIIEENEVGGVVDLLEQNNDLLEVFVKKNWSLTVFKAVDLYFSKRSTLLPALHVLKRAVLSQCECGGHLALSSKNEDKFNTHPDRNSVGALVSRPFSMYVQEKDEHVGEYKIFQHYSIFVNRNKDTSKWDCHQEFEDNGNRIEQGAFLSAEDFMKIRTENVELVPLVKGEAVLVDCETGMRDHENKLSPFEQRDLFVAGVTEKLIWLFLEDESVATKFNCHDSVNVVSFEYALTFENVVRLIDGGFDHLKNSHLIMPSVHVEKIRNQDSSSLRCPKCNAVELCADYGPGYLV